MYFYNMGFIIDNSINISNLIIGEEIEIKPNLLNKEIDVFYKNNKIGNLLDREGSIKFESPDLFCERLFKREKWIFNFYIKGIYEIKSGKTFGEFDMNSFIASTGVYKNSSLALIGIKVTNSGKEYVHHGGFREVYGIHGEKAR